MTEVYRELTRFARVVTCDATNRLDGNGIGCRPRVGDQLLRRRYRWAGVVVHAAMVRGRTLPTWIDASEVSAGSVEQP